MGRSCQGGAGLAWLLAYRGAVISRSKLIPTVAATTVLVTLAACSGGTPAPAGSTSATTSAPTSSTTTAPTSSTVQTTVTGASPALAAVITNLYAGKPVAANALSTTALAKRKLASAPVSAQAAVGTWRGQQLAVVRAGDDITLTVNTNGAWRIVGGWWPSLGVAGPVLEPKSRWILALGSDARVGQNMLRTRADTQQIVGVDGKGGGGVLGLPRDLYVPLTTGGSGKINSAMAFGGPEAQVATVRQTTGLPIEGYVVTTFNGFIHVVDGLGGIPMNVPTAITTHGITIKAGPQTLSGLEALWYARERKSLPDGDFGRSRHQGQLIVAGAIKARLAGPMQLPKALTLIDKESKSNLSAEQILTFGAWFYKLDPNKVGTGVAYGPTAMIGGQSVVRVSDHARGLFADFRDGNLK